MNFIKKFFEQIKNMFNKKENVKILEEPTQQINENNFTESLKVTMQEKKQENKIETLICEGDGLGIQKKMSS